MKNYKGVFFDCYGTLFQYGDMTAAWNGWLNSILRQCRALGLNATQEQFSAACHGFFSRPEPVMNEKLTVLEKRMFQLLEGLDLKFSFEDIRRIVHDSVAAWHKEITIDDDTVNLLSDLKGMSKKIALVSNFDHPPYLKNLLNEHRIDSYFDSIVISGEVGVKKPDPAIFSQALKTTKLDPKEVVYVGDTDEDIEAARAARILPILIQRNGNNNISLDYLHDQSTETGPMLKQGEGLIKIHRLCQLKEML